MFLKQGCLSYLIFQCRLNFYMKTTPATTTVILLLIITITTAENIIKINRLPQSRSVTRAVKRFVLVNFETLVSGLIAVIKLNQ